MLRHYLLQHPLQPAEQVVQSIYQNTEKAGPAGRPNFIQAQVVWIPILSWHSSLAEAGFRQNNVDG